MISQNIGSNIFNDLHADFSSSLTWSSDFTSYIKSVIWGRTNSPSLILALLILENVFFKYINPALFWSITLMHFLWVQFWCAAEVNKLFSWWINGEFSTFFCPGIRDSCLGHFFGCNDVFCLYYPTNTESNKTLRSQAASQARGHWPLYPHKRSNYIFRTGLFPKVVS